ncbi:MAG TPA: B12-binding domain-containing radical SAM protein [Sedimentisphaerales bacterium]|nr:B12-binding domain-containing radical SAM protein [Sedimentisphaerales bacterium]
MRIAEQAVSLLSVPFDLERRRSNDYPVVMRILLVNPPIHDFTGYDFWLKPYGLLSAAGMLRGRAELVLFDFLDRRTKTDAFGRGPFPHMRIPRPTALSDIPRHFYRFGRPRDDFRAFLASSDPFDFALIQTVMTWWYPGVAEAICDIRSASPGTCIVLGGVYATLCARHARTLGADFVLSGTDPSRLESILGLPLDRSQPPFWEGYKDLMQGACATGVLRLTDGCPFKCTYCSVPQVYPEFMPRPLDKSLRELELLISMGIRNIAFYDDALLCKSDEILLPFLREASARDMRASFHTPNALHARYINPRIAETLVASGFRTFYLGYESAAEALQQSTGGKVSDEHLAAAVKNLLAAGADPQNITAYVLAGHPVSTPAEIEAAMRFVHSLGIRITLSDFSPVPGAPDAEAATRLGDMSEPLNHNKTAWPIRLLGNETVNRLKDLCRLLNGALRAERTPSDNK